MSHVLSLLVIEEYFQSECHDSYHYYEPIVYHCQLKQCHCWKTKANNKSCYAKFRRSSELEKHLTIKNCDKIFLKIIARLKIVLKNDDVSTLAERHYQVKNMFKLQSINTEKNKGD